MKPWHPYSDSINLLVKNRISPEDARRQERTAKEILQRLATQPGVVLADEVGMGKTFVALAVAASVGISENYRRPVVVMVPPSLREKWPRDFDTFRTACLPVTLQKRLRAASANSGVEFLKLLDDPLSRRNSLIFLTHGAMHAGLGRGITGGWIKLAVIQRAMHRRKNLGWLRRLLHRRLGDLLEMGWIQRRHPDLWKYLLDTPCEDWLKVLRRFEIDPEGDYNPDSDDDPIPKAVARALKRYAGEKLDPVLEALRQVPVRDSYNYADRLASARWALNNTLHELWHECLRDLRFQLPLLILDEAHHVKNAHTRLASLFQVPEAEEDAAEFSARGPLGGVFERMLFLTATPFQLGHHELCSVLERFDGICWRRDCAPATGRDHFHKELATLRESLDTAQGAALSLDAAWGKLTAADLELNGAQIADVESWWEKIPSSATLSPKTQHALDAARRAQEKLKLAEQALRPWVIRHRRSPNLTGKFAGVPRRKRLPGRAILDENHITGEAGIPIPDDTLLPFLLAARATVCMSESRPVFAEGLASSYEAFQFTRQRNAGLDGDAELAESVGIEQSARWYLAQLERALPLRDARASAEHPKIRATAERVLNEWNRGEKVVVFCHFIETGRALRRAISHRLHAEICRMGAKKLRCSPKKAAVLLQRYGKRFFDTDSPARLACDNEISALLKKYRELKGDIRLHEVIRRYIRTPSFMARFLPLTGRKLKPSAIRNAFHGETGLAQVLRAFLDFLTTQCTPTERDAYLEAIGSVQTGDMTGRAAKKSFTREELTGHRKREPLLPNVRLVNGATQSVTRQRLMLTFNSPFFPEILITSNVLAEGVDLHRFCRYVIHHDLDWNPSVLEQRTGRIDRIGAKVERDGKPIHLYLPYVAETQDEKLYRVVMDRERWFSVVMGEQFKVDARTTDKLAQRVPLPASLAKELAFHLEV